jgi:Ran GTPase-activating protein (RanGAP) involved in mRNA processing and transport
LFNCAFTIPLGRSVVHLKLNNCNFGDVGAELIAAYVRDGYMPATRAIDVSGNNITKTGEGYFVKALENPNTQDITITLASTVKDMQKVGNEAMKAMYDFVVKGLRYAVQEHVKNNAGTKWDINRVRSDQEIDKWKDCKDTVFNIGMGYFAGLVKCASTSPSKDPYSMFICSSIRGGLEGIAQPEALHCIGDINQEVSDSCSIM